MNKFSYKNKRVERVKRLKNLTLSTPDESLMNEPTSGVTSYFHPHPITKEEEIESSEEEKKIFSNFK